MERLTNAQSIEIGWWWWWCRCHPRRRRWSHPAREPLITHRLIGRTSVCLLLKARHMYEHSRWSNLNRISGSQPLIFKGFCFAPRAVAPRIRCWYKFKGVKNSPASFEVQKIDATRSDAFLKSSRDPFPMVLIFDATMGHNGRHAHAEIIGGRVAIGLISEKLYFYSHRRNFIRCDFVKL